MKKIIRLEIQIECDVNTSLRGEMWVTDSIATEYDRLLDADRIIESYKLALKKLGNFTMLTISVLTYNDGDYMRHSQNMISSCRFVNRYHEVKFSPLMGDNCYSNFQPSDKKDIMMRIKSAIEKGNNEYINLIKNINTNDLVILER